LDRSHNRILRRIHRVRAFLRSVEVRGTMDTQSLIMLITSAVTIMYLFYALLRPEKF
jgi:F subunit of K+-transporting ATPase (Potass_KdpF)